MLVSAKVIVGLVVAGAALVAVSTTLGVVLTRSNPDPGVPDTLDLGKVHLTFGGDVNAVRFDSPSGSNVLHGTLGKTLTSDPEECAEGHGSDFCLDFDGVTLKMNSRSEKTGSGTGSEVVCEDFQWDAEDCRAAQFEDCFDMRGSHWYGGTQIKSQLWPVEKWVRAPAPYVTGDSYQDEYGGVQERYWLSSNGVAIYVQFQVPLWVSMNNSGDGSLCLRAQFQDSPYEINNLQRHLLFMNYSICRADGIKQVHQYMIDNYLGKPENIPDELLFKFPIWSTWAQYKRDINQEKVAEYAQNIRNNGFNVAQLEIDDHWELTYGYMDFDPEKFPDPKQMVDDLRAQGMRTTIWIHPFVDITSDFLWVGGLLFHYHKDPGGVLPALTTWWNGVATHLDITSERTAGWFADRLRELRTNYGIHSYKFDAGESDLLPWATIPDVPFNINPSALSTRYAELAYSLDTETRSQEVRVAARSQRFPIFVRMMDKDSNWGWDNGMKTVIPHALTYSILGYPFILPDMIGGNAYNALPDRELYIRWVQLNAFLPGFQFSIAPWDYDQEVVDICKSVLALHEEWSDTMISLAREAVRTGVPIVRPVWWVAPRDEAALTLDSEFLLGDDLLAAPVLEPGARARDVYLPPGRWEDKLRGGELEGGRWYTDYRVELNELAYFTRVPTYTAVQEK